MSESGSEQSGERNLWENLGLIWIDIHKVNTTGIITWTEITLISSLCMFVYLYLPHSLSACISRSFSLSICLSLSFVHLSFSRFLIAHLSICLSLYFGHSIFLSFYFPLIFWPYLSLCLPDSVHNTSIAARRPCSPHAQTSPITSYASSCVGQRTMLWLPVLSVANGSF